MANILPPIIIAIVGPSGAGKTTAAQFTSRVFGLPVLCSYTTRPMRPGETDGIDHHFVTPDQMPPRAQMLAYTLFGDYHYWTTPDQLSHTLPNLYVIDEDGLRSLQAQSDRYSVVSIYIDAPQSYIVDADRLARDTNRVKVLPQKYNHIIVNDSTLEHLLYRFTNIVEHIFQFSRMNKAFCQGATPIHLGHAIQDDEK